MKPILFFALLLLLAAYGCTSKRVQQTAPKGAVPINTEEDLCQLCWMPIPDNSCACEVLHAGKILKFDAIECLVGYLRIARLADSAGVELFVRDAKTNAWLSPDSAFFFHGEINSPMGGGIVAFADSAQAAALLKDFKGAIIHWDKVMQIPWADIFDTPQWKRSKRIGSALDTLTAGL